MAPPKPVKKVLEDFIEIYKSHPCLWQVKSKSYRNRKKKEAAYQLLAEKLKEIEPEATKVTVVNKINSLRSNVRKERRKYEQSLQSGDADDVHCIRLWYYDLFNFIFEAEENQSNLDSDEENSCSGDHTINLDHNYHTTADQNEIFLFKTELSDNEELQSTSSHQSSPPKPARKRRDETERQLIEIESDHNSMKRPRTESRCDLIGQNVTMKLRGLDERVVIVAEKLINDLLFEAEMGHLTTKHAYVNMRDIIRQAN